MADTAATASTSPVQEREFWLDYFERHLAAGESWEDAARHAWQDVLLREAGDG